MQILIYLVIDLVFCLCDVLQNDITEAQSRKNFTSQNSNNQTYITSMKVCPISSCQDDRDLSNHRPFSQSCYCDKNCIDFGDCCEDSIFYKKIQQNSSSYSCEFIETCYYQIKTSCANSWYDMEVAEKCQLSRNRTLNSDDFESNIPVTSILTNITYGNLFCALCNNEENFVGWNIVVNNLCEKFPSNYSSYNNYMRLPDISDLKFQNEIWYFIHNEEKYVCNLHLRPSDNFSLNYCYNRIDSCSPKWNDISIVKRCNGAYAQVYGKRGRMYKNKYCAYCNGVADGDLKCQNESAVRLPCRSKSGGHHAGSKSLEVLFNYKLKIPDLILRNDPTVGEEIFSHNIGSINSSTLDANSTELISIKKQNHWFIYYTSIAIFISLMLLCVHLIVFIFVKELHTTAGKNQASFCLALVLAYSSFLLGNYFEGNICYILSVTTYYSFLSAFCWMLIISFNMWRTFWNVKNMIDNLETTKFKFISYSILSWTIPIIPSLLAIYLDFKIIHSAYAPHFGKEGCWFENQYSLFFFFVIPVTAIILVNFVIFFHTTYLIYNGKCNSDCVNRNSYNEFKIYARMGILTGLTWITGFIAGYFQNKIIWFMFISLNTAHGLFIFLAFTLRKQIIMKFLKNVGAFRIWKYLKFSGN